MEKSKQNARNDDYKAKIHQKNSELRDAQNKIAELEDEMTALNQQATTRTKLDIKRKEQQTKQDTIRIM